MHPCPKGQGVDSEWPGGHQMDGDSEHRSGGGSRWRGSNGIDGWRATGEGRGVADSDEQEEPEDRGRHG
jgi:hypothetical protein